VELAAAAIVEPDVAVEDGENEKEEEDDDDDDERFVARTASAVEGLEVIAAVDAEVAEVVDNEYVEHLENTEEEVSD